MTLSPANNSNVQTYVELLLRHKWWLAIAFCLGTLIAAVYSYSLPSLYRATTVILVEPQHIPTAYVTPTVTSTVQERLSTISQQILSRTNLEKIILQFNLYHRQPSSSQGRTSSDGNSDYIRTFLGDRFFRMLIRVIPSLDRSSPPMEILVERMRNDIEVKVMGGNNAFSISYVGTDPLIVMKVTNLLASLFIEENLRLREQQAEGTSEFLANEHAEAKKELERQERALKEFKEQHMGALPEQMNSNLRTLDRLQAELQTTTDAIKNAEDRRIFYQTQLADLERLLAGLKGGTVADVSSASLISRLEQLKEELTRLQVQFKENYPDIGLVKKQIREIEDQLARGETVSSTVNATANSNPTPVNPSILAQMQAVRGQLQATQAEIESLRAKQNRTAASIKEYEKRVEDTFSNEQKLLNLTRDYEMSHQNYQALLQKRLNARISENLEKRQKSEQFRIVDPAKIPERPYKPDRRKIVLLGALLGIAVSGGIIILWDFLRPSYRKPEDFQDSTELPVLVAIPTYKLMRHRDQPLITQQQPDSLIAEQYRLLYTRLMHFTTGRPQTVFAISSAMAGEGKSVTSLNLALVAARDFGRKTLLIEGDFKNPAIATYIEMPQSAALRDYFLNGADLPSSPLTFGHDYLSLLPFGSAVKNSAGLLSSERMEALLSFARERYDCVILDSPPVLSLPDMHLLEKFVDGILLVVRAERTPKNAVISALASLSTGKLVGIVLNDVKYAIARYHRYAYTRAALGD